MQVGDGCWVSGEREDGCWKLRYGQHEQTEIRHDSNLAPNLWSPRPDCELDRFDASPASVNNAQCNQVIVTPAQNLRLTIKERLLPFKFGGDFGWYYAKYPSSIFGLGSGEDSPTLHHQEYDSPNQIAVPEIISVLG